MLERPPRPTPPLTYVGAKAVCIGTVGIIRQVPVLGVQCLGQGVLAAARGEQLLQLWLRGQRGRMPSPVPHLRGRDRHDGTRLLPAPALDPPPSPVRVGAGHTWGSGGLQWTPSKSMTHWKRLSSCWRMLCPPVSRRKRATPGNCSVTSCEPTVPSRLCRKSAAARHRPVSPLTCRQGLGGQGLPAALAPRHPAALAAGRRGKPQTHCRPVVARKGRWEPQAQTPAHTSARSLPESRRHPPPPAAGGRPQGCWPAGPGSAAAGNAALLALPAPAPHPAPTPPTPAPGAAPGRPRPRHPPCPHPRRGRQPTALPAPGSTPAALPALLPPGTCFGWQELGGPCLVGGLCLVGGPGPCPTGGLCLAGGLCPVRGPCLVGEPWPCPAGGPRLVGGLRPPPAIPGRGNGR